MHILPFSLCLSVPPPPYALCCAFAICALSCLCQLPQITSLLKIFSAVTLFISFSAATTIPAPPARVHHLYFAQNSGRWLTQVSFIFPLFITSIIFCNFLTYTKYVAASIAPLCLTRDSPTTCLQPHFLDMKEKGIFYFFILVLNIVGFFFLFFFSFYLQF